MLYKITIIIMSYVLLAPTALGQDVGDAEFKQAYTAYLNATNRDEQVEYLRQAILARPDHRNNIEYDYLIAAKLETNTFGGLPTKPLEALKHFEYILTKYNYDDYYQIHFREGYHWTKVKQNLLVQSAIQASALSTYKTGKKDMAQEYAYQALDMLNNTFHRRTKDWLDEPPLGPPPEPITFMANPNRFVEGHKIMVAEWEKRKEGARTGNVFERGQLRDAKIAVQYYGLSFGRQGPEMVPFAMKKIIDDFPGTPMAKFAQEHIDRAAGIVLKQTTDEALAEIESGWFQDIPLDDPHTEVAVVATPVEPDLESADIVATAIDSNEDNSKWYLVVIGTFFLLGGVYMFRRKKHL